MTRKILEVLLKQTLSQITQIQRHIRLCKYVIKTSSRQESCTRASRDLDRALCELSDLEVSRDRLREEINNSNFKG